MHASYGVYFFQPFSTLPRRVDCDLADIAERQSPDGNKHPRGIPTFLTPVKPTKRVPLREVAHQRTASATKYYSY